MRMAKKDPIRIGKISSFDFKKGVAKITYENRRDSTTVNFSMLGWGEY